MTIYRLEDGTYGDTRTATAAKLARALGYSLDTLVGLYELIEEESEALPTEVA
jgi:hypothetical protein